jgi:hypothetical protein
VTDALALLATQGMLGAFDTVYYHEYRARLPARREARAELAVHGARAAVYAVVFWSLAATQWDGAWAWVLAGLLGVEIVLTLVDFVIEDRVRRPQGGVFPGERVTHAVMGIVYGAFLARLAPHWLAWVAAPTALEPATSAPPAGLALALQVMALGVLASGLRDVYAAAGGRHSAFPWPPVAGEARSR